MHSFDSSSSNVPAFLVKLWKLVEDQNCDDLIAWSESGYSFIIKDQARFAKDLLPQYFKHSNMASFIRQLNMYGFKKVMNYEKSGLRNENSEMEFQHGFFIKDRGELLELIKRKISNPKIPEPPVKSNAKDILFDLTSIREKQENMDSMLLKMKQENELLWRELTSMRQKHKAQEQIIQKVIQFLVSIVQRSGNQNLGVGVQRKITRMLHDSPSSKPTSSQVSRTIDVLRNKNSDCIIVPEQMVSPLGPVIHEVTDCDHEDANSPSISVVKSPTVITVADSPANKEAGTSTKTKAPIVSTLNSSSNLAVPMESFGILEALQNGTSTANKEDSDATESILGIPLEYIAEQGNTEVSNVISIPDDGSVCNVISIPEDSNIGNVISIPEGSSINDIIPISKLSNVISIPENESVCNKASSSVDNSSDNVLTGSEFLNASDIAAFSELQPCTSNESNSENLSLSLSKNDFVDNLLSESLQTPKIITSDDEVYVASNETKKKVELAKSRETEKSLSTKDIARNEHKYQLATTDSSTNLVKNALSNHLLSVDEKLNLAQDQLASNPWNIDVQNLLGVCGLWNTWTLDSQLFSTDELVNYDALSNNLNDDLGIKTEPNDIIGNEIVQFTPNMLEVDMDIVNTPLFETFNQDAESSSTGFDYQSEPLLDILKEASITTSDLSSNQSTTNDASTKRRKHTKSPKTKRRKAK
ncbi:heat shock factor protein [Trichonephila inaurata madagascariensis]|uniref:Heat shock factor protein n=1 Tax=Trichonephila inaurata madagascariensis TaxID=2747483 RepID=A0A8X6X2Y5_9ARAC|nr:heat shock factor protein [Trichonephila inaurata madagascariensis]